ncbi:universal stress protein [Streptomyces sp. NPDC046939]|uniref:universal stress protein n=1 Tax=Streptomyces sp. NPDC046939 TaxID=3155376 RepID=UPI0033EF7B95
MALALHGVELRSVHASLLEKFAHEPLPVPGGSRPGPADLTERILRSADARAAAHHPRTRVFADAEADDPEAVLLRAARNALAVVVGRRGRGPVRELLLGSVSLAVAAQAQCPVIVVRGSEAGFAGTHERVLLGVGSPDSTGSAVRFAFAEAAARHCVLDAMHAWRAPVQETADPPLLADGPLRRPPSSARALLDEALREPGRAHPDVFVRPACVPGPARRILIDRSAAADLLIIGARRRHGHIGLQLGPVGHAVLHHADCPVAVVPQHGS